MCKVSVVIPTMEREDLLREAIATVCAQSYQDVELIIVDDSDYPKEDIENQIDEDSILDLKYIYGRDHRNSGAARNTGIREATGEYIAFLDDDDLWHEDKIQRQVSRFHNSVDNVGVVYTGQRYLNENGATVGMKNPASEGWVTQEIISGKSINPFSCLMVRSKAARGILIDEDLPFWEDREWLLRLSKKWKFESIPEPLTIRRMGDHDQLGDDLEARLEAYQVFLDKHRELAASYGLRFERKFISWLSRVVAVSAIQNGNGRLAIIFTAHSIRHDPMDLSLYPLLIVAVSTPYSYSTIQLVKQTVNNIRYPETNHPID